MENNKRKPIPNNVIEAIQKMFLCNGFDKEFICFHQNYNDLKDCSFFIYSDEEGEEFPDCFKSNFQNDFAIVEIGCSDKYYVIDSETCEDMIKTGESKFYLDICVELDTQVVSYLKSMFKSREEINIYENKRDLFYYLSTPNVNYSSLPYLVENAKKITADNFQECYLNLKSYEIFKNFDYRRYVDEGEKYFDIDESNMLLNVDDTFNFIKSEKFHNEMKDFYDMQENTYCLLMKAILIENMNSKKSANNKMKMLIEFMNDNLGVFCEREMAICYYYFEHSINTEKFFKKAKANSKNLSNTIKGMAWDLTHVRMVERFYDFTPIKPTKFGIHPILTYDNGLKDVLKLYPIKKMAIYDGYTLPCFKYKFYEIFPEAKELIFENQVKEKRMQVFKTRKIEKIKKELEEEIDFMNVNFIV